ncbi:MAG TPA: heme exporter protein CcmB [bacterium]|jgi:heme exporter protein B|nr:heme exporter protein CcmB [bacterium]HOC89958.1 heme exporter protein CcmB [bacterium]HOZ22470.1 heme exporter protein CcmB [bacterium]
MLALTQLYTILHKDLLQELRSKEIVTTMLVFSLTVVVIFNFVFDPGSAEMRATAPGILWVAFVFASNLGLSRSFAREQENSMMHGLLLCPVDRSLLFTAKVIGNILFITLVEIVTLPVMVIFFDLEVGRLWPLLLAILLLGTAGFATVGTIFSAISANTRSREVMLPIMLFPVTVPIILAAIKSTSYLLAGRELADIWPWLRLLIGFDVLYFFVCFLLYEYVVEE